MATDQPLSAPLRAAQRYAEAIIKFARGFPSDSESHDVSRLANATFSIACVDWENRLLVQLMSSEAPPVLVLDETEIDAGPPGSPKRISFSTNRTIESILFPGAKDPSVAASLTIGQRWVTLDGLAFSDKTFSDKYWRSEKFYRNVASPIPFRVQPAGCLLALNILYGCETRGERDQRFYEFLRIFGQASMIPPRGTAAIDLAWSDFSRIISRTDRETPDTTWSFSQFLNGLEVPVGRNVLVLGPYRDDSIFVEVKRALVLQGLVPFLLSDAPDLAIQSSREKLLAAIICSCFVIVLDYEPSGHIAELDTMLQLRLRPVVVLRKETRPSTWFLEDRLASDDNFRIAILPSVFVPEFSDLLSWARKRTADQASQYNEINHWRTPR